MFFLQIEPGPAGGLDRIKVTDDRFRFLLEIEGRKPAVGWLKRHGCCPGAAERLTECDYGKLYNINSPADAVEAHTMG